MTDEGEAAGTHEAAPTTVTFYIGLKDLGEGRCEVLTETEFNGGGPDDFEPNMTWTPVTVATEADKDRWVQLEREALAIKWTPNQTKREREEGAARLEQIKAEQRELQDKPRRERARKAIQLLVRSGEPTEGIALLGTKLVGDLVERILLDADHEARVAEAIKLIEACVAAGIVEPSRWEKTAYPDEGLEDGFSFKWVNHYVGGFVLRYEGWEEVARNLHVLCQEVPEAKKHAEDMFRQLQEKQAE